MTNYNFESHNIPGFFIRHFNFEGELTRQTGPINDFAFAWVKRGEGQIAFKSVNFPDRRLRHQNFRVRLHAPAGPNDQLFRDDSTFSVVRGLADDEGFSFRSMNFPDRYLRHRDFHLWVEPPPRGDDELFKNDATFHRTLAAVIIDKR
jgi:hypothetical protein